MSRPQRFRGGLRRRRFWLLTGAVFLAVAVTMAVLGVGGHGGGALSADNPAPEGAMAAAQVLRNQGVVVQPTDSLDATLAAVRSAGSDRTTVLLYDANALLNGLQLKRLSSAGSSLVLVEPRPLTLLGVSTEITLAGASDLPGRTDSTGTVRANCGNADASAAGSIDAGNGDPDAGKLYHGPVVCFTDASPKPAGLYAASTDGRITVLGNRAILSNGRLDRDGNAALVLRMLGKHPNLVWYIPSINDIPVSSQSRNLSELTPDWLVPAGSWLLIVAVIGMLWKGRRDGPLVVEPLPVVVRAAETAAGRARLYQDGHATRRAAATLRAGTLTRLARHLRLGPAATADD
ncbi:MAG: DUF4350 domain-containing protein, partial [Actinomycetota bacterium]|nr:DUF4350 domain-containing protein [Actinomycetota bacterium]